jgi:hypothetical protein
MRTDLPVIARLTLDALPDSPAGAQLFNSPVRGGLPHSIDLFPRWRAVLSRPTGVIGWWLRRDPFEPIDHGAPRLRFQLDGATVCVVPLVTGQPFRITRPDGGTPLDAMVTDWQLHAGDMRGPGNYGSFVTLAAAIADKAAQSFGPVPVSDFVIPALPKEDRTESRPGTRIPIRFMRLQQLRRFSIERTVERIR